MAKISAVGRTVFWIYTAIILVNVVVLALSARVNIFQEFYFVADKFPLAMSIITLIISVFMLFLDVGLDNAFTAHAAFEIGMLSLLSILWLALNAFSSSRWKHIPMNCFAIPSDYPETRTWCMDVQALQAFVWINWTLLFIAALTLIRYSVTQHQAGQKHIWTTPLSRFAVHAERGHRRTSTVDYPFGSMSPAPEMTQAQQAQATEDFLRFSR
ncbi:hypothetical protein EVG20_g8235 [Dentipellis fragilis]|uniref:MARVEL domain-containing protein n=1 Tax=Dentipellis fragilis TaxID=205917 RepID=A0A4Y9Y6T1_9AGAM|nr:hypothetical protein EVG20_g8235 [Dentipellis fragilis]